MVWLVWEVPLPLTRLIGAVVWACDEGAREARRSGRRAAASSSACANVCAQGGARVAANVTVPSSTAPPSPGLWFRMCVFTSAAAGAKLGQSKQTRGNSS